MPYTFRSLDARLQVSLKERETLNARPLVAVTRASLSSAEAEWSEEAAPVKTEGGHDESRTTLRTARASLGDLANTGPHTPAVCCGRSPDKKGIHRIARVKHL